MLILGLESLTPEHPGFTAKAVLNAHGIIFLPIKRSFPAPKGRRAVATGEAQRNP